MKLGFFGFWCKAEQGREGSNPLQAHSSVHLGPIFYFKMFSFHTCISERISFPSSHQWPAGWLRHSLLPTMPWVWSHSIENLNFTSYYFYTFHFIEIFYNFLRFILPFCTLLSSPIFFLIFVDFTLFDLILKCVVNNYLFIYLFYSTSFWGLLTLRF